MQKSHYIEVLETGRMFASQKYCWETSLPLEAEGTLPITICNNFFDMALLNWAHLFGNSNDQLHYRKVVSNPESFKKRLLVKLAITEQEWEINWKNLKDFRDNRIAHIDKKFSVRVPELNIAALCISEYYSYAREELVACDPILKIYDETLSKFITKNSDYWKETIIKIYKCMQ